LWKAAGFDRVRFLDDALTVVAGSTPGPERRSPALPSKQTPASLDVPPDLAALQELPLISCLMITKDRLALAKRSIRCFADQIYPRLELVVVSEGSEWYRGALQRHVEQSGVEHVRFVKAEAGIPLGALRNMSLEAAEGAIVCQWDDDDCNHPDRIMYQADQLVAQNGRACFLTDHLQLLEKERMLFWIDWTMGGRITDGRQLFPGTVMMYKDDRFRYPETGPYARHGEDSVLIAQLYRNVAVTSLSGMGHLYLYDFHGRNTFSQEHHYRITSCSAPNDVIQAHADKIREAVRYYPIPKPVVTYGAGGAVFGIA
jgi:glycosyltransferase involved in cell wall biosynthesis